VVALKTVINREADRLGVSGIRDVLDSPSGSQRQRELMAEAGLDSLCHSLVL